MQQQLQLQLIRLQDAFHGQTLQLQRQTDQERAALNMQLTMLQEELERSHHTHQAAAQQSESDVKARRAYEEAAAATNQLAKVRIHVASAAVVASAIESDSAVAVCTGSCNVVLLLVTTSMRV
jgi:hypothetical protein